MMIIVNSCYSNITPIEFLVLRQTLTWEIHFPNPGNLGGPQDGCAMSRYASTSRTASSACGSGAAPGGCCGPGALDIVRQKIYGYLLDLITTDLRGRCGGGRGLPESAPC